MSIVLVGGHDRMHTIYKGVSKKFGCRLKVFTQMPAKFSSKIGNPDGILVFTKTASHNMVGVATKEAKRKNIPIVRCHNSSVASLEQAIKTITNYV